jgi:hypothetical protein
MIILDVNTCDINTSSETDLIYSEAVIALMREDISKGKDAVDALLNIGNINQYETDSGDSVADSALFGSSESENITDNDKDSYEEIKTTPSIPENIKQYTNSNHIRAKHDPNHFTTSIEERTLVSELKEVLEEESTNKKDLMKIEKQLEKVLKIIIVTNEDFIQSISDNRMINNQNIQKIEKFKAEKNQFLEMKWSGSTYIISAFTLGYSHHSQHQINYQKRSMFMFPANNENSKIIIKDELFRYLPISVYTLYGSGYDSIILYSMTKIAGKEKSRIA